MPVSKVEAIPFVAQYVAVGAKNQSLLGILMIKERKILSKDEASNHGSIHIVLHRFYRRCPRVLHQLRLAENCQW